MFKPIFLKPFEASQTSQPLFKRIGRVGSKTKVKTNNDTKKNVQNNTKPIKKIQDYFFNTNNTSQKKCIKKRKRHLEESDDENGEYLNDMSDKSEDSDDSSDMKDFIVDDDDDFEKLYEILNNNV